MTPPTPSGIVTLTTDFGLDDHFVGVMKGVVLTIFPEAKLVDLTHGVRRYQIEQGAFYMTRGYRFFPPGTVHVGVIDPGVGTHRRALVALADGHYFVAPDNGLLTRIFEEHEPTVLSLDVERYALKAKSKTFHGRDVFAPAAAHLASGKPFEEFGPKIDDFVMAPSAKSRRLEGGRLVGRVLNIDHFGNIVTSFRADELSADAEVFAGDMQVRRRAESYEYTPAGRPFLIVGSSGYWEISMRQDSAADHAGVSIGDRVEALLA